MSGYPGLGFDPTPGDVSAVSDAATAAMEASRMVGNAQSYLADALQRSDGWSGDAADDFHDTLDNLPHGLTSGQQSMAAASSALSEWAGTLATNKQRAEELDTTARALKRQISDAEDDVQAKGNAADLAQGKAQQRAGQELAAASIHLDELTAKLRDVIAKARTLQRAHQKAADAAADALDSAADGSPLQPASNTSEVFGVIGKVAGNLSSLSGKMATVAALVPGAEEAAPVFAAASAGFGGVKVAANVVATHGGAPGAPSGTENLIDAGFTAVDVTGAARGLVSGAPGLSALRTKAADTTLSSAERAQARTELRKQELKSGLHVAGAGIDTVGDLGALAGQANHTPLPPELTDGIGVAGDLASGDLTHAAEDATKFGLKEPFRHHGHQPQRPVDDLAERRRRRGP